MAIGGVALYALTRRAASAGSSGTPKPKPGPRPTQMKGMPFHYTLTARAAMRKRWLERTGHWFDSFDIIPQQSYRGYER